MYADVKGSLERFKQGMFEHNGQRLSRAEALALLNYAAKKGYATTGQLSDQKIQTIINNQKPKQ